MGGTNHKNINIVSHVVGFLCLVIIWGARKSEASEFSVGGDSGWSVPPDNSSNPFNRWAEKTRFLIGDSLVFVYQPNQDSVLYVTKDAYDSCDNESYISKYVDGHTVFKFNRSGGFHFISGVKDNCLENEKLVVVVLADRSNKTAAPSPSPSEAGSTTIITPSPAPSGEESPSPPVGMVELNPSPAPTSETSPPPPSSGPRSALGGFTVYIAAVAATSALLVL